MHIRSSGDDVRESESRLMTLTGVSVSVDVSAVTSVLLPIPVAV